MSRRSDVNRKGQWLPGIAIALAVSATFAGAGKQPVVEDGTLGFQLPDLAGRVVNSTDSQFTGRALLVEVWATWCPPCVSEIPTLVELQKRYGDRGLVIVAIAFVAEDDEQRRTRLREFVTKNGINYVVLDGGPPAESETALPSLKNVRGFPVEILIDGKGRVAAARNGYGYKKKWAKKLNEEIEALLTETVQ